MKTLELVQATAQIHAGVKSKTKMKNMFESKLLALNLWPFAPLETWTILKIAHC